MVRNSLGPRLGNNPIPRNWKIEFVPLLLLVIAAGGAWAFIGIADEIREGDTLAIEKRIMLAFRSADDIGVPIGPEWVWEAARDISSLGGVAVLGLLVAGVAGFLFLQGKRSSAVVILLAIGTAVIASLALKSLFSRERPAVVSHEARVYTSSFPSGHAMLSAVTYLTLGSVLMRVSRTVRVKVYCLLVSACLTILVGVSRVYLGVHWPSDVLAGWSVGAAWAMIWWLIAWCVQRRRVERENEVMG